MSFIQVPIGKGITKFPSQRFSEPEFTKESIKKSRVLGDLQFLENLSIDNRLVYIEGDEDGAGQEIVSFTPNAGDTFFFLGASCSNRVAASGDQNFEILNNNISRQTITVPPDDTRFSNIKMDRLVGNSSIRFAIVIEKNVDSQASIWGYTRNTEKIGS